MRKILFVLLSASAIFAQDCILIFSTANGTQPDFTGKFTIPATCNDPISTINNNPKIKELGRTAADYRIETTTDKIIVFVPKH